MTDAAGSLPQMHKPMIGMIHLAPLPGSVAGGQPLRDVTARASEEAEQLTKAGFDALLLQNTGDVPAPHEGGPETVAYMTHIAASVRAVTGLPLGINVLMNGSKAALAIASAVEASFVRIKVIVGAVVASTGLVSSNPHDVLAFRQRIGAQGITILADVYDRTAAPAGEMPIEVLGDLALRHGGADGLVVAGYTVEDTMRRLQTLRRALPGARLYVGGGANAGNVASLLQLADGVIVGSAYKTGGHFLDPVDPAKAAAFMRAANAARGAQAPSGA